MTVHKRNNATGQPVCWTRLEKKDDSIEMAYEIDDVDCVFCLRALVKDAVIYGVVRKPGKKW
jgi:hypothetical protein